MRFSATAVADAVVAVPEPHEDERGVFARTWDEAELAPYGLPVLSQSSVSFNPRLGTLRGMHYQRAPHEETKLVRCTRGRMQDVVVDLRPESPTYLAWASAELSAENRLALLVPPGCGHGFLTLERDTEVLYLIGGRYVPEAAAGVRWDDPLFGIAWQANPVLMSERDGAYPDHVR
jgi:dTDP-4-dehydrorhamnose 3,5-epimerase